MTTGPRTRVKALTSFLDKLAEQLGIEDEYRDARGKIQKTSANTKRALLAAMKMQARDETEAEAALKEFERASLERTLQPAYVVFEDKGPIAVEVNVVAGTNQLDWRLRLEDGSEKSYHTSVAALALTEKRTIDGKSVERRRLPLGDAIPLGYHILQINDAADESLLIVTPGRCWSPISMEESKRLWGISAQLYLLRSETNWGIGDFSDLRRLVELSEKQGADIIGLNPLHATFLDDPEHASPYSPASRLFLNVLYIDPREVPGFSRCADAQRLIEAPEFIEKLQACRSAHLVDYTHVAEMKLQVLRILFAERFKDTGTQRDDFAKFCRDRGEALQRNSVFHCLRQKFASQDPALRDWRIWPEEYRRAESPSVDAFARQHADEITFVAWLEWLADMQLAVASAAAERMEIGLYRDMAVGSDVTGVETWSNQDAVVSGVHIGAPPDIYNPAGQDWGLPPFDPRALRDEAYRGFIDLIRANMRYAGALRIDHVMGLQHLYWIPESQSPKQGAYVRYPLEDLVGILALESQRNRCMVVGEDLGTVPDGFRERMAAANILSYRVLFFEQNSKTGVFRKPQDYPRLSVAVASNHDLPTIRSWWEGSDISLRENLHLFPDPNGAEEQRKQRVRDRSQLLRALKKQGLLSDRVELSAEEFTLLVHAHLAKTSSFLAMVQIDDAAGEIEPVNLPASREYPNWRRRLSVTIEELFERPMFRDLAEIFRSERSAK